jgi:AraC-like DNA-binding protein
VHYSTLNKDPQGRSSYWHEAISNSFFPLDMAFREEPSFSGDLKSWSLGMLSLSLLKCDAVLYKRHEHHLVTEREKNFLISIPEKAEVRFKQSNRDVHCAPGGFVMERGDAPYEFSHPGSNTLWVLKVPSSALRARVGPPERFAAFAFDATKGIGACFIDTVRSTAGRLDEMGASAHETVGRHIIDLLCLAIENDERVLDSNLSSVRAAHLFRAEQYIRNNLAKSDLQPQSAADACGISLRYLQRLFTDSGRSISEWIREQRLLMCDEELRRTNSPHTISEIAYRWGFADQSQFSKHYRAHFGQSPSEARGRYKIRSVA